MFCTFLFLGLAAASNIGGVRTGIERVAKTLMPALLVLLVLLAVRALTLPGAAEGLAYYMRPDFSQAFNMSVFGAALGQAFFSLSLGNGAMLTYGSYLRRSEGIGRVVLWVVLLDTFIALLAGLIIFPAGFSIAGFDPASTGPGLIFAVLPELFATLVGGRLFGGAFFVLLVIAALTSAISLLEVPVAHVIDRRQWSRPKAVLVVSGSAFLLSIPCVGLRRGRVSNRFRAGTVGWEFPGLGCDALQSILTSDRGHADCHLRRLCLASGSRSRRVTRRACVVPGSETLGLVDSLRLPIGYCYHSRHQYAGGDRVTDHLETA